jgi:hypothetical protein
MKILKKYNVKKVFYYGIQYPVWYHGVLSIRKDKCLNIFKEKFIMPIGVVKDCNEPAHDGVTLHHLWFQKIPMKYQTHIIH